MQWALTLWGRICKDSLVYGRQGHNRELDPWEWHIWPAPNHARVLSSLLQTLGLLSDPPAWHCLPVPRQSQVVETPVPYACQCGTASPGGWEPRQRHLLHGRYRFLCYSSPKSLHVGNLSVLQMSMSFATFSWPQWKGAVSFFFFKEVPLSLMFHWKLRFFCFHLPKAVLLGTASSRLRCTWTVSTQHDSIPLCSGLECCFFPCWVQEELSNLEISSFKTIFLIVIEIHRGMTWLWFLLNCVEPATHSTNYLQHFIWHNCKHKFYSGFIWWRSK